MHVTINMKKNITSDNKFICMDTTYFAVLSNGIGQGLWVAQALHNNDKINLQSPYSNVIRDYFR